MVQLAATRRIWVATVCVMAVGFACARPAWGADAPAPGAPSLVFRNVRVFDGERRIERSDVVVRDGVIVAVGPGVAMPTGAEIIDGAGRTLLPGLIDCHTHTFAAEQLVQAAVFGVTTELDMASNPAVVAEIRAQQGQPNTPARADLLSAGTPATAPGGHPTQIRWFKQIPTLDSPEQAERFVAARFDEGSDYLKLIHDDGSVFGLAFATLDVPTMAALVKAAHDRGKPAVAHVATHDGADRAISAGVDGLVHLFMDRPIDDLLLARMAREQVFVVPTLGVIHSAAGRSAGAALADDPAIAPYLMPDDVTSLRSAYPKHPASRVDPSAAKQSIGRLISGGGGAAVLAGTDAPNPGTIHGASMHRELELLVEAGLTPEQALAAATALPARHFKLADRGRIVPGLRADLLLVEGDPTEDITATQRIVNVWVRGRQVNRLAHRLRAKEAVRQVAQAGQVPPPPNSESGLVSDFEAADFATVFGSGWMISTDSFVGGKSTATITRTDGGAGDSKGSMRISGTIEERPHPRWAGATFSPGPVPMVPANLSAKKTITFQARGDGREYYLMVFFQRRGFQPSMKTFTAGEAWQEHRFEIKDFDGCDGRDITGVFLGAGPATGEFSLRIDDLRFESD